jgi:glycosyltransferase involved in cell wall biosynthesis
MKILFITRAYPPLVGGMQKYASDFYNNYQERGEIKLLANSGDKKTILPFFFKVLFFLVLYSRQYDVIHLYDAVLFPLIPIIRFFSNAKISFTVNGLDIVYSRFGYQKLMPFFLKRADKIFAISKYTMKQCEFRGIPREKLVFIPVGLNFDCLETCSELKKSEVISKFDVSIEGKKILLTVGRLVKRKGHYWFIANVLKNLPVDYIYLIAGVGPEQDSLIELIRELDLTKRVYLLGRVSDEEKNCLYQISDIFVMPNISVKNDQEGFGIVLLEAGRYGLPTIASNIEGIRDAVIDRKTGFLVEEKNAQDFLNAIMNSNIDRSSLSDIIGTYFDWKCLIERYYKEFEKMKTR